MRIAGLEFFEPEPGPALAFLALEEVAGIIVDGKAGHPVRARNAVLSFERIGRLLEVEVLELESDRLEGVLDRPVGDDLPIAGGAEGQGMEVEPLVAGDGSAGGDAVGQDQAVAVGGMIEPVVDPLRLEQTADEVEIGFAVLDAIAPAGIGPGGPEFGG